MSFAGPAVKYDYRIIKVDYLYRAQYKLPTDSEYQTFPIPYTTQELAMKSIQKHRAETNFTIVWEGQ